MSGRSTKADVHGWKRGLGAYSKDELWGEKKVKSDYGSPSEKHRNLTDSDEGMGSGDKLLGGGGPVSKGGPPTHRPKSGPIGNFNKKPK